jgi:hypothetical protein
MDEIINEKNSLISSINLWNHIYNGFKLFKFL